MGPGWEAESTGPDEGRVAVAGKANSRLVPILSLFRRVPGRANEAEGLSGEPHQLHPQEREDGQVSCLGGSLSGQNHAHPGPGAARLEDLQPPLLRVAGVLPSVHISGDVTLVSLQSMDRGVGRGDEVGRAPRILEPLFAAHLARPNVPFLAPPLSGVLAFC